MVFHSGLICISLVTNDGKHFSHAFFAINIYSSVKCVFKSFATHPKKFDCFLAELKGFYIFSMEIYHIYASQIFSPGLWLAFSFSSQYLLKGKIF